MVIPEGATISPAVDTPQNFTDPVTYTITALDGSTREYVVTVTKPEMSERDALIAMYNASESTRGELTWDLDADISSWQGVTVANSKVIKLSFFGENYVRFTEDIKYLIHLETIELIDIDPEEAEIGNLPNLKNFIVDFSQGSSLEIIPGWIGNLKNLERLKWIGGRLRRLPDEIGNLKNLKVLDLNTNLIQKLPKNIENLKSLEILDLRINDFGSARISDLGGIGGLTSLKELYFMDGSDLSFVFSQEENPIYDLESLEVLDLNSCSIEKIHMNIGKLLNLRILNLGNNDLTELPFQLENIKTLRQLIIESNILKIVPSSIGNLPELEILDLSNNTLTDIPTSFENLKALREFNISQNNALTSIPLSVCDLEKTGTTIIKDDTTICQ